MNAKVYSTEYYLNLLEEKYAPSTFKFIGISGLLSHLTELFKPLSKESKDVKLYMHSEDGAIDEKEIENDLAVVAKDFIISVSRHGRIKEN